MSNSERRLLLMIAKLVALDAIEADEKAIRTLIRRVHIDVSAEEKKRAVRIQREAALDERLKRVE